MFVTAKDLQKYKACEQGIKYIERFYPDGAELIDIIQDRHINKEFLHWGREHLTVTEAEVEAYCKACNIVNSKYFWYSQNVLNSKYVIKSKDVAESKGVFESSDVVKSCDVVGGDSVNESEQIFYSSMIDSCTKILKGQNITESNNICNSTMVARSTSVIDSFNVFDSSEIIRCNTVTDSHFCQDCKDIAFCMFCEGLEGVEYHIFNRPVDKTHYEVFIKQYKKYLTEHLSFVREWPKDLLRSISFSTTRKFDDWYSTIPEKFWKWARTLPNFDSMLLYNITMLPEILIG